MAARNWRQQEASLRLYMVCVGRTPAPRGDYGGSSHEPHILTPAPILPCAGKAPILPYAGKAPHSTLCGKSPHSTLCGESPHSTLCGKSPPS